MNKTIIKVFITIFITLQHVNAQEDYAVDKWVEYLEEMASLTDNQSSVETLHAELSYLSEHPLDINRVGVGDLLKLPFLDETQANEIVQYREKSGRFLSVYELKHISSLDFETISLIVPFIAVKDYSVDKVPLSVNNVFRHSRNELQIRLDRCFQQKAGYGSYPDSILDKYPNKKYVGEPLYTSLRYSSSFDDRIYLGLVAEKDAGESFFRKRNKGYDFYSFHLLFKDMNRWLKTLAVGDYKVSFGQGLVMSHDFFMSKSALVTQMERSNNGIRRHYSTNETDFFRGIASTLSLKNLDISLFYSYKQLDGNVENSEILSFKTDGLHRTELDLKKKNSIAMNTFGTNMRYSKPFGHIGFTALYYTFGNLNVNPDPQPYNLYYFRGNDNTNLSIDYRFSHKKLKIYGETAISANGALATLNALQLTPASYFSFLLLQRYYDKKYHAFYGNSFTQNSMVCNEQGVYLGLKFHPFAYWQVSAYADVYKHPWLRYGVDKPSEGSEYMMQIDWNRKKNLSFNARYRYKDRTEYCRQQLRAQLLFMPLEGVVLKTSLDGNLYKKENQDAHHGYMISQSIGFNKEQKPIRADLYVAWFDTQDYFTRMYSYEKNILYAFNSNSFYGKGIRVATTLNCKVKSKLSLAAKFGLTKYLNQDTIGSGLDMIEGSLKTDLLVMVGYVF